MNETRQVALCPPAHRPGASGYRSSRRDRQGLQKSLLSQLIVGFSLERLAAATASEDFLNDFSGFSRICQVAAVGRKMRRTRYTARLPGSRDRRQDYEQDIQAVFEPLSTRSRRWRDVHGQVGALSSRPLRAICPLILQPVNLFRSCSNSYPRLRCTRGPSGIGGLTQWQPRCCRQHGGGRSEYLVPLFLVAGFL
jgi:hypothetical protein